MATLTVGVGQTYTTIAAAVAASGSGDTIDVLAGTYTNDFVTISHDLTLNAVGGTVKMVATVQPPNGKAIITEGAAGVSVTIAGFDMSGATVPDGNGAAIRYEGGNLTLTNDFIHDNQEGILSAPDPNGTITIDSSTFSNNGSGTGFTHNIYIGDIASLTVENSTISNAVVGHDIKSRAHSNTIVNNTIIDGSTGTASYEIDLPNGGAAVITGNVIEKGPNAQNPNGISFGEEGNVYANSSLTVQDNIILNDQTGHTTTAVVNATGITATISGNELYGWSNVSSGPANASGNVLLTTEPALSGLTPGNAPVSGTPPVDTTQTGGPGTPPTDTTTTTGGSDTLPTDPTTTTGGAGTPPTDTTTATGDSDTPPTGNETRSTDGDNVAVCSASLHHAWSPTFISHGTDSGHHFGWTGTPSRTGPAFWASVVRAATHSHRMDGHGEIEAWRTPTDTAATAAPDTQTWSGGHHALGDPFARPSSGQLPHSS